MRKNRLVVIGLCALLVVWVIHFATNHFSQFGSISGHTATTTEGPSALVRSLRPSYPYSIIAGGAYSPQELRFADSKDSVVRQHYADFDMKHAQLVRLIDDRFQYVSYRIKNEVYWTKKKLRIPSGELLLTDGTSYARARCGNRLSDKPHAAATSAKEPEAAVLSLPPVNLDLLPKLALATPPASREIPADPRTSTVDPTVVSTWPMADQRSVPLEPVWGGQPITGIQGVIGPQGGGFSPSNPSKSPAGTTSTAGTPPSIDNPVKPPLPPGSIATVPEPSTIYLFFITLIFLGWALLRVSKEKPEESQKLK